MKALIGLAWCALSVAFVWVLLDHAHWRRRSRTGGGLTPSSPCAGWRTDDH
jgi:hypothetical protein